MTPAAKPDYDALIQRLCDRGESDPDSLFDEAVEAVATLREYERQREELRALCEREDNSLHLPSFGANCHRTHDLCGQIAAIFGFDTPAKGER